MSSDIYSPGKQGLNTANTNSSNLSGQNVGAVSGYSPYVSGATTGALQQWQANPYSGQAQTGANAAGAYGTNTLTPQMQTGATDLFGLGALTGGYAPQALQTGFDPQNALYNREYQRTIDQQNAINAMSGVSGTPYGAGVTGQAAQNFNTDWLNQALGRQATAAGTANNLIGGANAAYTGGANLGTGAINTGVTSSALPYSTYTQQIMDTLKALSGGNLALGGATGATSSVANDLLNYLQYGTGATQAKAQDSANTWSGIGQTLGGLAGLALL